MKCIKCKTGNTKVIDARDAPEKSFRRRRECLSCKSRFTTYELPYSRNAIKEITGSDISGDVVGVLAKHVEYKSPGGDSYYYLAVKVGGEWIGIGKNELFKVKRGKPFGKETETFLLDNLYSRPV